MAVLDVKNLKKIYRPRFGGNQVQALSCVNFSVEEGEYVAIMGESGSGKTTLLNIIGGLDRYDSGDLIINGISTKKYKDRDWDSYRNHTIGFVFQSYNLIPHQSILANVELALTISGVSRNERRQRAKAALEQVGLGDQLHKKPNQMSGGQMQRVALARALAAEPSVLLLDEPFSGLDERLRAEMGSLVRRIHRERKITTILVTHDSREALQMSDRIVLMKEGSVLQCGTPEELFWRPASREAAEYFGRANYLRGTAQGGIFDCGFLKAPLSASGREGECEAMVRPFSIKLTGQGDFLIREIIFMGETAEILLDTPQGEIRSQMMSREFERLGLKKGSRAGIEIEEAYCI